MNLRKVAVVCFCACFSVQSAAFTVGDPDKMFSYPFNPEQPRSVFWSPFFSVFIPGLSQVINGQIDYGIIYGAMGLAGVYIQADAAEEVRRDSLSDPDDYVNHDDEFRRMMVGMSVYKTAGGLSGYHAFRSAANSRRQFGEYDFLKPEKAETSWDLMLAPFDFTYAIRPTTFLPLLTLVGFYVGANDTGWNWANLSAADGGTVAAMSYGAGVGEEAMFRGWILPYSYQSIDNFWAANATQAVVFGALHYSSSNQFPIIQTLLGAYFGWMVRRNDWQLGEAIFMHTWWDVIAIGAHFIEEKEDAFLRLPTFEMTF
jgi:membrane protease YdiL (CAAX protease family)